MLERRDADRQEGRSTAHHQDVTGPKPADTEGLDDGGDSAYHQRREHGPVQVGITFAGDRDEHRRNQHDAGNGQDGVLKAQTDREGDRGTFVGLVADSVADGGWV